MSSSRGGSHKKGSKSSTHNHSRRHSDHQNSGKNQEPISEFSPKDQKPHQDSIFNPQGSKNQEPNSEFSPKDQKPHIFNSEGSHKNEDFSPVIVSTVEDEEPIIQKDQKPPHRNRRNSKRVSKNRRAYNGNLEKKPEVCVLNSCVEEKLSGDSSVEKVVEGSVISKEKVEGSGLHDDDVWTKLEELQLGAEEPELSPEQLRINDQAQEDEDKGGCGYFKWIDPSPEVELLKEKLKEVELERDTLKYKMKELGGKYDSLKQKLKEIKEERDCAKTKFNRLVVVVLCFLLAKIIVG